jgi:hypothetical protein
MCVTPWKVPLKVKGLGDDAWPKTMRHHCVILHRLRHFPYFSIAYQNGDPSVPIAVMGGVSAN